MDRIRPQHDNSNYIDSFSSFRIGEPSSTKNHLKLEESSNSSLENFKPRSYKENEINIWDTSFIYQLDRTSESVGSWLSHLGRNFQDFNQPYSPDSNCLHSINSSQENGTLLGDLNLCTSSIPSLFSTQTSQQSSVYPSSEKGISEESKRGLLVSSSIDPSERTDVSSQSSSSIKSIFSAKRLAYEYKLQQFGKVADFHGAHPVIHFQQGDFLVDKLIMQHPNFMNEIGLSSVKKNNLEKGCFGLSMCWLHHHQCGLSSKGGDFFQRLENVTGDPLMKSVLFIQHRLQHGFMEKNINAKNMLNSILPFLKMKITKAPSGENCHMFLDLFELEEALNNTLEPGKSKSCLILGLYHSVALQQHANGTLEYFDPNYGVIRADSKYKLSAVIKDSIRNNLDIFFGSTGPNNSLHPGLRMQLIDISMKDKDHREGAK